MRIKISFLLFFTFSKICLTQVNYPSKNADSLTYKSYNELLDQIDYFFSDPIKGSTYTDAYLKKAKKDKDIYKIIESFYYLSQINESHFQTSLRHIDSAIFYNKTSAFKDRSYLLYKQKGNLLFTHSKYKEALDAYVNAKKLVNFSEKDFFHTTIDYNIGLLMLETGAINDALKIFNKSYHLLSDDSLQKRYSESYLRYLEGLSYAYLLKKQLDSASYFNQLELKKAVYYSNTHHYKKTRITEAFINYEKEDYNNSLDSIEKYIPYLEQTNDQLYLAITYLYKGKNHKKLNDSKQAVHYFKKVDTIIENKQKYISELRENYDLLFHYYKGKKDIENQLLYITKFIKFDSILDSNIKYLNTKITSNYNTPKLIKEKNTLITQLQKKDSTNTKFVFILSSLVLILMLLTLYYYRKRSLDKQRFEAIINQKKESSQKKPSTKKQVLNIPNAIVEDILEKIEAFENSNGFLDNTITLINLSKVFKTNSNYLSRIINFYKGKNFSNYLSGLRIDYAIHTLKVNPKLREYTIKAIAFEMGFNNVDTFTNAFYKNTQIHPSYFIRQLKKNKNLPEFKNSRKK